jgi:hypothetical protein
MRSTNERLVWSVEEAGRRLGISRAHAYELVARGELRCAVGPAHRGAETRPRVAVGQRRLGSVTSPAGAGRPGLGWCVPSTTRRPPSTSASNSHEHIECPREVIPTFA